MFIVERVTDGGHIYVHVCRGNPLLFICMPDICGDLSNSFVHRHVVHMFIRKRRAFFMKSKTAKAARISKQAMASLLSCTL